MAAFTRRKTEFQSVFGGFSDGETRWRFHSSIIPDGTPETTQDRPYGAKEDTSSVLTYEASSAPIDGKTIQLAELVHFLPSCIGNEAISTGTVNGKAATFYDYSNSTYGYERTRGLTVVHGENELTDGPTKIVEGFAESIDEGIVNALTLNFAKKESATSGTILGGQLNLEADFDATGVVQLPNFPVLSSTLRLSVSKVRPTFTKPHDILDEDADGLVPKNAELALDSLWIADDQLKGRSAGPDGYIRNTERTSQITSWVEGNAAGRGLYRSLRDGDQVFVTVTGATKEGFPLVVLMSATITAKDNGGSTDGLFGYQFTFKSRNDDVWGGSLKVRVTLPTTFAREAAPVTP